MALCASNPLSTQDEVAAALVDRYGAEVFAIQGEAPETYYRHIEAICDKRPQVTLDDGADLISVLHGSRADQLPDILGGTENTTTGVIRVRALEAQGKLAFPVIAVNDAATSRLLDNEHGTGQSTLDGILRATNVLLAGRRVVVVGFGACGRGVALRAKGAGAKVIVCEVDPVRALEAAMEGYEVMPAVEAAARGDVFITVTGNRARARRRALRGDGRRRDPLQRRPLRRGDRQGRARARVELACARCVPTSRSTCWRTAAASTCWRDGRVVNLAAGEGHPAAVMDMGFSAHALSVEHIAGGSLEKRVYPLPEAIDAEIARLKLDSLGMQIDGLTPDQVEYLHSWEQGT